MYKPINLLIVDDDEAIVKIFTRLAKEADLNYKVASTGDSALDILNSEIVEVAVVDIMLPGYTGMQILEYVKKNHMSTEVIIITGVGTIETAVSAIKLGAYDYITKPFEDINKISIIIEKAGERFKLLQKIKRLEKRGADEFEYEGMIGRSKKIEEVFQTIENIAGSTSTVIIMGESGTGKELVAKAVHNRSKRADRPFVVINCAALPETLLESELFGHKKGSFTGAIQDKKGLFEVSVGGTIFLDEIGEVPSSIQVKLLRVLQEGEIRAVGDTANRHVDVRLIAATNKDLGELVSTGKFREDLYYRLNVIAISLPPMRERKEDIPILAFHFLKKFAKKMEKAVDKISPDALQSLCSYSWVGNVRELENVIERAVVLVAGDTINAKDLPPRLLGESFYLPGTPGDADLSRFNYQEAKDKALESFNKSYISALLKSSEGNLSYAAAKAGVDRSNFKKIINRYSISLSEFKKK